MIRRTDTFFASPDWAGNNRAHRERLIRLFGFPVISEDAGIKETRAGLSAQDEWRNQWGYIHTAYVHNSWIASSYIGGPHGWMHPDGTIGFSHNVGKWPSVDEVATDWAKLASAFPFIDVGVTLMDREWSEDDRNPVVSMIVRDGSVRLVEPMSEGVHVGHPVNPPPPSIEEMISARFGDRYHSNPECGIDNSWFKEWATR